MSVKEQPEKALFNGPKTAEYLDLMDLLNKYRILTGLSWHDFIMVGFSFMIREDNEDLADACLTYVKNRRGPGRPKGQSVKSNLQRMGVNPQDVTNNYK